MMRYFIYLIIGYVFHTLACAQSSQNCLIKDTTHRLIPNFTSIPNFSNYQVYDIAQNKNNIIYISTDGGTYYYDGSTFNALGYKNGLKDDELINLQSKGDKVWFNTLKGELGYINQLTITFPFKNKKNCPSVKKFHVITDSLIYLLDNSGVLYVFKNNSFYLIKKANQTIIGFYTTQKEECYLFTNRMGIYKLNAEQLTIQKQIENDSITQTIFPIRNRHRNNKFCLVQNGNKLGMYHFESKKLSLFQLVNEEYVLSFYAVNEREVYVSTNASFYKLYLKNDNWYACKLLTNITITNIFKDNEQQFWLTTINNGIIVFNTEIYKSTLSKFIKPNFTACLVNTNKSIVIGNSSGNLYDDSLQTLIHLTAKNTKRLVRVTQIIKYTNGLIIGRDDGLFYYSKPKFTQISTMEAIKKVIAFSPKRILCGNHTDFYVIDETNKIISKKRLGRTEILLKLDTSALLITENGWWHFLKNDSIKALNTFKVKEKNLCATYLIGLNQIAISVAGHGVKILTNTFDSIASITEKNGLSSLKISSIYYSNTHQLVLASDKGLFVSTTSINSETDYTTLQFINYLGNIDINEVSNYNDSLVLLRTYNSIYLYAIPKQKKEKLLFPFLINQINAGGLNVSIKSDSIIIPYNQNTFSIDFKAISTRYNQLISYAYKIDETQNPFTNLNAPFILINNLEPGTHLLSIKVLVNNIDYGIVKTFKIIVTIPFWKQSYFIPLLIFLGLVLIISSWFYFINNRNKKNAFNQSLKRKESELKLQALQSRMNPHFIFNCLQSIQSLFNNSNKQAANDYLIRYAKLTRQILNHSEENFQNIDDEIDLLENYIAMENIRYQHSIQVEFSIEEDLETYPKVIPSLTLQPLVENAIIHGIVPNSKPGKLSIRFKLITNYLVIEVEDNGVGIKVSKNSKANESKALKNIQQKVSSLNNLHSSTFFYTFELTNTVNFESGTLAILKIPYIG